MFCSTLDMSDIRELEYFLNVRVTRTSSFLRLDQTVYVSWCWRSFQFSRALRPENLRSLAIRQKELLVSSSVERGGTDIIESFPYRSLLGALSYF